MITAGIASISRITAISPESLSWLFAVGVVYADQQPALRVVACLKADIGAHMVLSGSSANLLLALHRWAWRQDENFTSEAFAHLLDALLQLVPTLGTELIRRLTSASDSLSEPTGIAIRPQETVELAVEGGSNAVARLRRRPDIVIDGKPYFLAYVEVKVDSKVSRNQLSTYWDKLANEEVGERTLVLLTRDYPAVDDLDIPVAQIRWFEVAQWLAELAIPPDAVQAHYLRNQFVEFLRLRGLTMEKVGSELVTGVRSLVSLLLMVQNAVTSLGHATPYSASTCLGYSSKLLGVYIYLDEPEKLYLEIYDVQLDVAESAGFAKLRSNHPAIVLDLDGCAFWAMDQNEQQRTVERFVTDAHKARASLAP